MSRSKAEPRCSPEPLREASTPMKAASVYGCRAWGLRFCETALGNLRDTSTVTPAEITSVRQPSAVRHGLSPPPTPMPYTSEQSGARQTRPLSRKCNAQTLSLSLCFLHTACTYWFSRGRHVGSQRDIPNNARIRRTPR